MRRVVGPVLLGLAGFLITAALLAALYVPGQVKKTPLDVDSTTRLSGEANALPSGGSSPVKALSRTVANGELSDGDVVVFDTFSCLVKDDGSTADCTDDTTDDSALVTASTDTFATDRRTALAVTGEQYVGSDSRHEGLVNKFPFGVQQETYPFWDGVLGRSVDAVYEGEEEIGGLNTYRFVTTVDDEPAEIAAGIEGTYSSTKTMWIDPATGSIISQEEQQVRQTADGQTVLDLDFAFTDETVEANVESAKDSGSQLALVARAPWLLGLLGLLAGGAGAFLVLRGRAAEEPVYADEAEYVPGYDDTQTIDTDTQQPYAERYPDRTDQFFEEATAPETETETRASRRDGQG